MTMKIELDFDNKIITIKQSCNLSKVVKFMKEHIKGWEDWNIAPEMSFYVSSPYYQPVESYSPPFEVTSGMVTVDLSDNTIVTTSQLK